jgi:hypothetical protein
MNLAFICDGLLKEMRVRGGHDWRKNLTTATDRSDCTEAEKIRNEIKNGGGERNG